MTETPGDLMKGNSGIVPTHINKDSTNTGAGIMSLSTTKVKSKFHDSSDHPKIYFTARFPTEGGELVEHSVYPTFEGGHYLAFKAVGDGASSVGDVV